MFLIVKEMLKHSRGRYTDKQILRTSKIVGQTGKRLDEIMAQSVASNHLSGGQHRKEKPNSDVLKFVKVCTLLQTVLRISII